MRTNLQMPRGYNEMDRMIALMENESMSYVRLLPYSGLFVQDSSYPVYDMDHISVEGPTTVNCIGYEDYIFYDVPGIIDTDGNVYLKEDDAHTIFFPDSSN